ncbi:MAG: carboxypeptidase regulatory-like domain-containing protein [Anaerolineales bacterium]|nr:carboxypeptidase regulatory-like domain-containing protein [Anaerolineales bacterium]
MNRIICFPILGSLLLVGLGAALLTVAALAYPAAQVSGVVVDEFGQPIEGAIVRQQTTDNFTHSGPGGVFTLGSLNEGVTVTITAWDVGFYPGGVKVAPPSVGVTISMRYHPSDDHPETAWLTSLADPLDPIGCEHCMVANQTWEHDAHAGAATNQRFFSLYNGSDLSGSLSVPPGYMIDFPGTAGNCATCHAPGAAANNPFSANMNELSGVETQGVFCDFCHKIGAVYLNPATGLPYPNAPGVLSYRLYRPPADTHMFFGPFDDILRRVSYLELEQKSQFCAACHQFSFWGTPIYESFNEWRQSQYASQGIECQDCHMLPLEMNYFVLPEKGGLIRSAGRISSHYQPGAADQALLENTVEMNLATLQVDNTLLVSVTITNTGAGHHVPTDFPGRHLILTLSAQDGGGQLLPLLDGPRVPQWGGPQAGQPGEAYAKLLADVISGEAPVVNYWKQTIILSDNRIPALGAHTTHYTFRLPDGLDGATVSAQLLLRRVFWDLAEAKDWDMPDIVMEQAQLPVSLEPIFSLYLPLTMSP